MAHIRAARRGSRVSTAIHSPAHTLTATSPFASRARAHTDYRVGADDARAAVSGKFWKFGKRSEVGSTSLALRMSARLRRAASSPLPHGLIHALAGSCPTTTLGGWWLCDARSCSSRTPTSRPRTSRSAMSSRGSTPRSCLSAAPSRRRSIATKVWKVAALQTPPNS